MSAGVMVRVRPGLVPVLKHLQGEHDQATHGRGGASGNVTDSESAWNSVLTMEAKALDSREKTYPDRYNPPGKPGYGLKDGAQETRVVRPAGEGSPPRLRDYETARSAGLTIAESGSVEGSLGIAVSGYGQPLVPTGPPRPPRHVYRVMSEGEFQVARERGYIKSDERMNLASGEGTVTSLRSTGSFYAPPDGSDYRVVRIKYADDDGWRHDPVDGYVKTEARIPFDRVEAVSDRVAQSVSKHLQGQHDQKTHGHGGGSPQLRNQGDEPINPDTAWVHETTWYHGTSRPGLETLDAREGGARYGNMSSGYAVQAYNFVTSDYERAAEYARDAARQDSEAGIEGVRPVVYQVTPTSDYFDPDPNGGPLGWRDGPQDMDEARSWLEETGEVSLRFHDVMDIAGAFDADTGEKVSVSQVAKHLPGQHDQKTHGSGGSSDLPDGWTRGERMKTSVSDAEGGAYEFEIDTYRGPNDSLVMVQVGKSEGGLPNYPDLVSDQQIRDQLETVSALQAVAPVTGLQVKVGYSWFEYQPGMDTALGFVRSSPNGSRDTVVHLNPDAVRLERRRDTHMGVLSAKPNTYTLVHEYGHILDKRSREDSDTDKANVLARASTGASKYALSDEYPMAGREAFAEAWTGWFGSQGWLGSPEGKSPFVQYFADKYNWNPGNWNPAQRPGPGPSAGFAKAAVDPEDEFLIVEADGGAFAIPVMSPRMRETRKMHGGVQMPLPFSYDAPMLKHPGHGDQKVHGRRYGAAARGSSTGTGTKADPVRTSDVQEALRALGEGKYVELQQPDQVSTLLDELHRAAKELGEEAAGKYDLCRVSIPGTNLFCADNKGIVRDDMPQLSGKPLPGSKADAMPKDPKGRADIGPGFRGYLEDRGVVVSDDTVSASHLRASQSELDGATVAYLMTRMRENPTEPLPPTMISRDNYIVDGHHRWAARVALEYAGQDLQMDVVRVDRDILPLLDDANAYATDMGIPQRAVGKSVVVRFQPGLRPVLKRRDANAPEADTPVYTVGKHLQGQHDQASHGHKGGSLDSATRAALAARADELDAQGQGASAATYRLRLHKDREGVRAFTRTESTSATVPVRDGQVATVATKAVHEVTPQARQILRDGGVSTPAIHELDPENGGAEFFHAAISRSKEGNPFHASVFVYEPSEYAGMRLFMAEDGQSGIALKGDEIVSLFKTGTSGDANVARPLMELAIEQGGRRGDCFDTVLPRIYAEHGLDVKSRIRWDDEYAPEGWDKGVYKAFNNGEPDVTFFRYDPAYTSPYSPGQGSYADSYDDAAAVTVAKRSVLVRFQPGLRPVLKHGDPSRPNYAQQHPDSRAAAARAEVTPEQIAAVFEGTYTTDSGLEFRLVADQVDRQQLTRGGADSPAAGGRIMVGDTAVGEWARGVEGDTMHALLLTVGKSLSRGDPGEGMSDREIQQREQEAATIGQYRGKGIALAVQRRTEEAARELGVSQIAVSTADDGDLAWANERFGYRFAEMPSGVRLTKPFELSEGTEPLTVFEREAPNGSIVRNVEGYATAYRDANGRIHRVLDEIEASPEYQRTLADFHRRFASDDPEEWPKPHEVAAFEGGKLLRFWGWKGVKDASHVTKAKRLMRLTVAGKGEAAGVVKSVPIRFRPGLRPVLKHGDPSRANYAQQHPGSPAVTGGLSGDGRYSEWGDRAADIRSAEDRGPTERQLQEGISASYLGPTRDEMLQHLLDVERDQLDMMIDNDQSLYEDRRSIEENRSMSPRDRVAAMNDLYAYAAFQLMDENPEFVEASMGRRKPFDDEAEAIDAFDQVYGISHSGVNRNGDSISLQSSVTEVEMGNGVIVVQGDINDENGDTVGQFRREFSKDSSGKMQVEHELLELWDETYQGTGFATAFNRNAENYYISHGIERIKVYAGLSTGGYTWARAGFDWDGKGSSDQQLVNIREKIDGYLITTRNPRSTTATQLRDISERMSRLPMEDPDFPTPNEIALAGFDPGVRSWAGQEIMLGTAWYGVKTLTPEGARRSRTEVATGTPEATKSASVSIRFQPGVRPVLKHGDPSRPGYAQQHPNSPTLAGMQTGRLADLPEKARKRVEAWCESNGFDIDAAADDMLRAFDDPATVAAGERWYREEFGSAARGLAERQGISVEEASAAIAITSARTRWADAEGNLINVRTAERFYQDAAAGRYDGMTAAEAAAAVPNGYLMQRGFGQNVIAMIKGEQTIDEAVTGAKRRSFFNNGTNPDTDQSVTMDVWMGQFMVRNSTMDIGKVQNALSGSVPAYLSSAGHDVSVGYFALREATMRAHDRAVASGKVPEGWLPMQTQATAWVAMTQGVYGAVDLGEG